MLKKSWWFIYLILAFICALLLASSIVSKHINDEVAGKIKALQAGHAEQTWELATESELVGTFKDQWSFADGYVLNERSNPVLSLAMQARFSAQWFESMHVQLSVEKPVEVSIELTDGNSSYFYYAFNQQLNSGANHIELSGLDWYRKNPIDDSQELIAWSDIKSVASVVLRFRAFAQQVSVYAISFKQSQVVNLPEFERQKCAAESLPKPYLTGIYISDCGFANGMTAMHHDINLENPESFVQFNNPLEKGLLVYLIGLIALTLIAFHRLQAFHAIAVYKAVLLVSTITVFIWLTHQSFLWQIDTTWVKLLIFLVVSIFALNVSINWNRPNRSNDNHSSGYDWLSGSFTVFAVSLILAATLLMLGKVSWAAIEADLPVYLIWAIVQQIVLGPLLAGFMFEKMKLSLFQAAVLSGFIFSLLHMPNQTLMLATWPAGVFWAWAWLTYKNIWPNIISHAFLALLFYQVIDEFYLHSARIGMRFMG